MKSKFGFIVLATLWRHMGWERCGTKRKGKDHRTTGHKSSILPRGGKRAITLLFLLLWL